MQYRVPRRTSRSRKGWRDAADRQVQREHAASPHQPGGGCYALGRHQVHQAQVVAGPEQPPRAAPAARRPRQVLITRQLAHALSSPAPHIDRPDIDNRVTGEQVDALMAGHRRIDVCRDEPSLVSDWPWWAKRDVLV